MAIIHNPDSEYSREMTKWNTQKRHGGFGANGYEPFPKMVSHALAPDRQIGRAPRLNSSHK